MAFRALLRWALFAVYIAFFFTLPLTLLGDKAGFVIGIILSISFLCCLGYRGTERIAQRLGSTRLAVAQAPHLFSIVHEYCRRLGIPAPQVGVMETPALNLALFGFSRKHCCLVITRGALNSLSREELSGLIGRQLSYLWYGDVFCESWLSQFLAVLDGLVSPARMKHPLHSRRFYPFKLFVRQLLLYPPTLIPAFLLRTSREDGTLDLKSVRMTKKPHALGEGLRILEALQDRIPFHAPFSTRHLFLLPPPTQDPMGRLFFDTESLTERIAAINRLNQNVAL